ncbi:MAG TPA: hypothetical protein DHV59_05300 [Oxalobacteraceae bacterium]|nr:hypothetical protein [Oxalobacteraceae bacterium]
MKLTKTAYMISMGSLLAALGSSAAAQDMYGTFSWEPNNAGQAQFQSTKTRAEVIAETQRLKLANIHTGKEISGDPTSHVASTQADTVQRSHTREAVRAEARQTGNEVPANAFYGSIGP